MLPCVCVDDSHPMFKYVTGGHYWDPKFEKTIKEGDKVFYDVVSTGVYISLLNNRNHSIMFINKEDFDKHFEDKSVRRNYRIKSLLKR